MCGLQEVGNYVQIYLVRGRSEGSEIFDSNCGRRKPSEGLDRELEETVVMRLNNFW